MEDELKKPILKDPDPDLDMLFRFPVEGGTSYELGIGKKINGWQIYNAGAMLLEIGLVFIRGNARDLADRMRGISQSGIEVPGKSYRHH